MQNQKIAKNVSFVTFVMLYCVFLAMGRGWGVTIFGTILTTINHVWMGVRSTGVEAEKVTVLWNQSVPLNVPLNARQMMAVVRRMGWGAHQMVAAVARQIQLGVLLKVAHLNRVHLIHAKLKVVVQWNRVLMNHAQQNVVPMNLVHLSNAK